MMFIPWFEVTTVGGDTAYFAALAVQLVNFDPNSGYTEIVAAGKTIKTRLSPDEVFERMGAAIEGAQHAELEAIRAEIPAPETATLSQRDTPRGSDATPNWGRDWLYDNPGYEG